MSTGEFSSNDRQQLEFNLRKVWGFGTRIIVGWRFLPFGIQVAYLSSYKLPKLAKEHPNLLLLDRRVNSDKDFDALIKSGCKEQTIDFSSGTKASMGMTGAINDIIRNFSVTYFSQARRRPDQPHQLLPPFGIRTGRPDQRADL